MLEHAERNAVAELFGVSEAQVQLDHLISHVLSAIAQLELPVVFFGGTALARTHLTDPAAGARLSEDIDLYSSQRREAAAVLDRQIPARLRREYPGTLWDPPLSSVRSVDPGQLVTREGLRLRVQLLDSDGAHQHLGFFPTESRQVELRYSDTPGRLALRVPTIHAFAAMKTAAWLDRGTARDLYDLAGLAGRNVLDRETAAMVRQVTGLTVRPHFFRRAPREWEAQLAHQTGILPSAQECLTVVQEAFSRALNWSDDELQEPS